MTEKILITAFFLVALLSCSDIKTTQLNVKNQIALTMFQSACKPNGLKIPENTIIIASGAYSGRPLERRLDKDHSSSGIFDLTVNSPTQPVALVLGAYDPSIWNISWTSKTKIVAVLTTGYHKQLIAGLTPEIPVITSTYENKNPCGYTYVGTSNEEIKKLSKNAFGKEPDEIVPANKDTTLLGHPIILNEKIIQANYITVKYILDHEAFKSPTEILDEARKNGFIRDLKPEDIVNWKNQYIKKYDKESFALVLPGVLRNYGAIIRDGSFKDRPFTLESISPGYMILKPFVFPHDIIGEYSAIFFLKKGTNYPTGDIGNSTIFDFNTMTCKGFECARPQKNEQDEGKELEQE